MGAMRVTSAMFRLVLSLLSELAVTALSFEFEPPAMYGRLLHGSSESRQAAMDHLRDLLDGYLHLRAVAAEVKEVECFLA